MCRGRVRLALDVDIKSPAMILARDSLLPTPHSLFNFLDTELQSNVESSVSVSLTRAFLPALHQNYLYERNLV